VRLVCGNRSLSLGRVAIMGVVNVTPDSFSDGGRYSELAHAVDRATELVSEGADIIDVGGESTRPRSTGTDVVEEIQRVVPLIKELVRRVSVPISIDTSKPEVMDAAVEAGAGLINDVCALKNDGALSAARDLGVPVCLMHMQGNPQSMQDSPYYDDVITEVREFLQQRVDTCLDAGIPRNQLLVDPGFGFGKNFNHNRSLILELDQLQALGLPITVGLSRKRFVGALLGDLSRDRSASSAGLALIAVQNGANVVRCHDVSVTRDLIRSWEVLQNPDHDRG